jgi:hypothetical protein
VRATAKRATAKRATAKRATAKRATAKRARSSAPNPCDETCRGGASSGIVEEIPKVRVEGIDGVSRRCPVQRGRFVEVSHG